MRKLTNGMVVGLVLSGVYPLWGASTDTVVEVAVSTPSVPADAILTPATLETLPLTTAEAQPCKIIDQKRPARSEAQVFYEHGIYSTLMPVLFRKTDQGFECGRDKGMVYYFEYNDAAGRKQAELGTRAILWKEDNEASPKRPEQIFGWDRFMIVMSFKTLQKDVMGALVKKLKRFQAAAGK